MNIYKRIQRLAKVNLMNLLKILIKGTIASFQEIKELKIQVRKLEELDFEDENVTGEIENIFSEVSDLGCDLQDDEETEDLGILIVELEKHLWMGIEKVIERM